MKKNYRIAGKGNIRKIAEFLAMNGKTPFPLEMTKASINAAVPAMDQAVFHQDPYGLALTACNGDSAKARRAAAGEPVKDWEYE